MNNEGNIPFYNCSANNPIGLHDNYSFDEEQYILLVTSGGSHNNLVGDNVGLGKCYFI